MEKGNTSSWIESAFSDLAGSLNGAATGAAQSVRKKALEIFKKHGLPQPGDEAWKYTVREGFLSEGFKFVSAPESEVSKAEIEKYLPDGVQHLVVFCNGKFSGEFSQINALPDGVSIRPLEEVLSDPSSPDASFILEQVSDEKLYDQAPLAALNSAFLYTGLFMRIAGGVTFDVPLYILSLTTASQSNLFCPQFICAAEKGSKATIVEISAGTAKEKYFTNSVSRYFIDQEASIDNYRIQLESEEAICYSALYADQKRESNFRTHAFNFGAKIARNEIYPVLNGKHSEATLNGLNLVAAEQHIDNYTVIDHAVPECESHELYKGIYGGKARGVFSGTIIVRPDAQKTNAYQSNKSILLSDKAASYSRPQLKIWADDVRCSHGATCGMLDRDALFYIKSRGVPDNKAREMLLHAFASEVIAGVRIEPLRQYLEEQFENKIQKA
ncbi:MAG: Fe-S cluster assembly protein SufD [Candidatus Dadabacteria bacterium]|nr:MAG: Fe-S cluster assembly protein SufD [Candidatus Dadabacteria bacterium]